jgi:autotransporter-associated beta strand protein
VGGPSIGIISVGGVVTSAGSGGVLTKDGASTSYLYLSGNNTYTGNTVVSSGVLNIQHTNALGTTAGTTSISNEAALEIQGGITLTTETINNSSKGITNTTGGIRSISGNNTIPGIITSAAASRINVDQDALTLTNSTSAIVLTSTNIIGGAGNLIITGKVTGASSLTMDGAGILSLSAITNDYTGQTIINSGMVKINNDNSLGNKTSSTTNNTIVSGTGTVYLDGNNLSFTEPFTISSPGTTVGGIIQGAIRNPTGINTLAGPITLAGNATIISTGTGTSDSLLITGNINTGSSTHILTLDVTKGVRLSNVISGTGGFTKIGSDTLLFYNTGANTYSGITTINGGVVRINSTTAFGNASSTSTAHTNITAGTLLIDISGFTIAEPFTIAGDGITLSGVSQGAIKTLYGKNNLTGQITLGASAKILSGIFSGTISDSLNLSTIVTSSPYALTIFTNVGTKAKGIISGTGSLIKEGMDTLLLSAVNTFTGSTKVTSGSLLAGIDNALSQGSEFIFNGGTYSSGGYSNTLGKLSVLDNSKINIRFLQVHGITYTGAASFVAGKNLIIYGWSGLTAPGVSKTGALIASNPDQILVYLRSTGDIGKSKSGGLTKYGQVVSASIGADFNGRIYFTNSTRLTDFQKNRLRFYVDPSPDYTSDYRYFSSTQNSSTFELLANDTIKTEPIDVIPTSSLTTNTISSIANTTAISGGNITATTDDVVIARGVVWSTTSSPTVDLSTKTVDGSGSGTFTSSITGLTQGTVYYVRAYATNNNRTDYGNQVTFTCCELIQYGLSSSLNAYNNASANSWVEITSSEYSNLVNTVTSTGKYGVNDAGMALTGYNQSWGGAGYAISTQVGATNLGTGVVATTIPANNYVYAFQIQYAGYTSNPSGDKVLIGTSNTTGFSQLGGDLPATTQASTSMTVKSFVLKGASSTVGSSAVYLGFLNTKAHTNYVPGNQYWNSSGFTTGFSLNSTYYTPMQVLATPIKNW